MTIKTVLLTSYDVPVAIKDKINAMRTVEEVMDYQDSVRARSKCKGSDPALQVWWACESVLCAEHELKMAERKPILFTNEQSRNMAWAAGDE